MMLDLRMIKRRALDLPEPVRSLILSEPDNIDSNELIIKYGTWAHLLDLLST